MRTLLKIGASIVIMTSANLAASRRPVTPQDRLGKAEALDTIRAVNTAEVTQRMQRGAFAPLGLAIQDLKWDNDLTVMHIHTSPESSRVKIRDYELSIVVSADAKHYMVGLRPLNTAPDCAPGWFSDESGVIYSGPSLECIK